MKALIKVGYGCNDHCSFCHTLDVRDIDAEAGEVHRKIARAKRLGHSMVVLSGGEPTIRPELLKWAAHVATLDMDFGLVTNGRMLSYPKLVDRLIGRRLRYVYLSLHGGTAKIHNLMVRSEAFQQSYDAIKVLSGRGLDFTVNCVITKHNVLHLRGLIDALERYPDVALKFSMVEPKGGGQALFEHLIPRVGEVADAVRDAIDYGRKKGATRVSHGAIPLCLMRGYEDCFDDLKTHRFRTMIEVGEVDFYPVDDLNKMQPEDPCRRCSASGPCPGLYRAYETVFGSGELSAIHDRPRGNSYHFVLEAPRYGEVRGDDPVRCPVYRDGVTPHDRGRTLFVREGARLSRYFTHTRDFSDAELERLKFELGQVYLDGSGGKPAPDDFSRDLIPLRRCDLCAGCEERTRCAGMFERLDEDPFTRDDGRVREWLAQLEGDVLDVGCGHGRYHDILRTRADAIRYTAFDPDPVAVADLSERFAGVSVGTAARWAAQAQPESLDHILVLRSWNHLVQPGAFLAAAQSALRVDGQLLIADDAAFGLVRTQDQAGRAERSGAALEHYRNDTAAEALEIITAAAPELAVRERRDVAPGTSTLWLLRLQRRRRRKNTTAPIRPSGHGAGGVPRAPALQPAEATPPTPASPTSASGTEPSSASALASVPASAPAPASAPTPPNWSTNEKSPMPPSYASTKRK